MQRMVNGCWDSLAGRRTFRSTNPPPGLVAWWSGDGHFFDLVGTNHGTAVGGVSFAPGEVGQAFAFATTSDWVRLPRNPAIFAQTVGTVEFWVRILSLQEETVRLFSVAEAGVAYPNSDTWAVDQISLKEPFRLQNRRRFNS